MFLIGILSTPLPYLLFLMCYLLGFAYINQSGHNKSEEAAAHIIPFESNLIGIGHEATAKLIHFHDWAHHTTVAKAAHAPLKVHCPLAAPAPLAKYATLDIVIKNKDRSSDRLGRSPPVTLLFL